MKPNLRSLVLLNGMPSVILKKKMKAQILHVPNFQLIDTLPKASKKKTFLGIAQISPSTHRKGAFLWEVFPKRKKSDDTQF